MIAVRSYQDSDRASLIDLFLEDHTHYKERIPSRDELEFGLMNIPDGAEILVAVSNDQLIGFAGFSALFPGPSSQPQLYLKELFVTEKFRSQGAGKKLMLAVLKIAADRKITRVDWTANAGNTDTLNFYNKLGARPIPTKIFYRIENDALLKAGKD